jgi:hypothetical protein
MNLLEKGISRSKIFWEIESFVRVSHDERCCWKNRRLEGRGSLRESFEVHFTSRSLLAASPGL